MVANPFKSASKGVAPATAATTPLVSRPRPDTRTTPTNPTRTPDRRVTPGRDPRVTPWRPKPTGPKVTPKFPKPWSPPKVDFGKKAPLVFRPPTWPTKFNPYPWGPAGVAGALLMGWWFSQEGGLKFPSGWVKCWDFGGPKDMRSGPTLGPDCNGQPTWDMQVGFQVPSGSATDPITVPNWGGDRSTIWLGPCQFVNGGQCIRMGYWEKWQRQGPFPAHIIPYELPWSIEIPATLPWSPVYPGVTWEPIPWAPPITPTWPKPEPRPVPNPEPYPNPNPDPYGPPAPTVVTSPKVVPSVDITTDTPFVNPFPDVHIKDPPRDPDKEKKKRLDKAGTLKWLQQLEKMGTSYLEMDDFVSAIYKGLPWNLRRWRGRDGVWRDRDHTTAGRLERIYNLFGNMDIEKAIHEVSKQEVADRVIGKIGQQLSDRAAALGDAGLYNRPVGFQYGNHEKTKQWEEFDRARKERAAAEMKAKGARTYKVKLYDRNTNSWYWEERQRPWTQIPWFRQQSYYPRGLTGTPTTDKLGGSDRYYYGYNRTYSPIFFPGEEPD